MAEVLPIELLPDELLAADSDALETEDLVMSLETEDLVEVPEVLVDIPSLDLVIEELLSPDVLDIEPIPPLLEEPVVESLGVLILPLPSPKPKSSCPK